MNTNRKFNEKKFEAEYTNLDNKTGWPAGLLQDDSRGLSKWLASKPDARQKAREAAELIKQPDLALEALK